ncbi:MAG TPA: glycosyltransferase family 4 protein [Armatimonadota bacterium]|nr:glycosyltransferase family 4 protein [Armatimonadota bacterium]
MRILHIITRMVVGGAQENTMLTVLAQQAAGHEVLLVTGPSLGEEGELETRARALGAKIRVVPELVRELDPVRDLRATAVLRRLIREGDYSVVHTHTSKAGVVGRLAARAARTPAIIHTPHGHVFHGYFGPWKTALFRETERFCARFTDRLIMLTANEQREHLELGIAPARKFVTIHSGVDFSRFEKAGANGTTRADLGLPEDATVIGCVARLVPIKGHEYLLRAMPPVLQRFPKARLLLVGDGPLTEPLRELARTLGIADRVVFAGLREDVPQLLRLMDLFALASLNEGMGRVLVEAGASRLPSVATRVSGIPDVIEEGVTGLLVDPASPEQMSEALMQLLEDPERARRMGEAAYRKVVPAFGVEAMVERIEAVYQEVLAKKAR